MVPGNSVAGWDFFGIGLEFFGTRTYGTFFFGNVVGALLQMQFPLQSRRSPTHRPVVPPPSHTFNNQPTMLTHSSNIILYFLLQLTLPIGHGHKLEI